MAHASSTDNNRGMLKGAIIGGAIGAAAALLLAPKAGRELRGDIRDRYADVRDRTKQLMSDASVKTRDVARQVGQHASDIADMTKSAVSAVKDEAQSWRKETREDQKDEQKVN